MGLAASQSRFLSLTARKSNVEYNGQQVNQQRMILSSVEQNYATAMTALMNTTDFSGFTVNQTTGKLVTNGGDAAISAQYNALVDQIGAIHNQDKALEQNLKDIDTMHNEIQTEIDAVKKVIDKNIDATFKTFA